MAKRTKKKPAKRKPRKQAAKKATKKPAKKPAPAVPPPDPLTTGEAAERAAIRRIKRKAKSQGIGSLSTREAKRLDRYERAIEGRLRAKALRSCMQKDLVELIGSPRKILLDWERDGMPRNGDRTYNLHRVLPWLKERWLSESRAHGDPESEAVKLRKDTAVARMKEIELGEREARLVPRGEAERDRLAVVQAFASMLERLPVDFRSAFPTTEAKAHVAWLDEWQAAERERLISQGGVA